MTWCKDVEDLMEVLASMPQGRSSEWLGQPTRMMEVAELAKSFRKQI